MPARPGIMLAPGSRPLWAILTYAVPYLLCCCWHAPNAQATMLPVVGSQMARAFPLSSPSLAAAAGMRPSPMWPWSAHVLAHVQIAHAPPPFPSGSSPDLIACHLLVEMLLASMARHDLA